MSKSYRQSASTTEAPAQSGPERKPFPPGFNPRDQARKLHDAMDRWGTDERAIFDVLRSGRADLNRAIESAFNRMYPKRSLRTWLHKELGGSDYTKAMQLLGRGDYTLAQKLEHASEGWGADEQQIFRALELATPTELQEVLNNAGLMKRLDDELNDSDFRLAKAYLNGHGVLAAKLRRAVDGWGTDEKAIWRAITIANDAEKKFVLGQPSLMKHLRSDLNESDYLRAHRMLSGSWDNVDKIEVAMKGWGTDEATLLFALQGLGETEFRKLNQGTTELPNGVSSLHHRLESELSGDQEFEALELLHQKRLAFDPDYAVKYQAQQSKALGAEAMQDEGSSALLAGEGQGMSAVARLKKACHGWGVDEKSIWDVCASIPKEQGRWILQHNPENVVGILRSELSTDEYFQVRRALGGGALGRIQVLRNAVEGSGTNERQIYDAIDAILAEGIGQEVLRDRSIVGQIQNDIDPRMFVVFRKALQTGQFSPMMRLTWATARYGTDEELVWEVCRDHGSNWYSGGQIEPGVDALLKSELSTRDYWKAIDLLRGPPESEQDRLARSKELLERERSSGVSVWLMDQVSDSGQNADEAWRDYQVAYNQTHEDGVVSEQETSRLREAEDYSQYTTEQYREAKATVAQWASQIAITIIGIVATVMTAGAAAGPFIAALSANAGQIATTMVISAVAKVGIQKAIEGEGYDLTSVDALIDGVGAAIEGGLFVVGNMGAARIMAGASKTQFAKGIGPSVEKVFGGAGKRILAGGLEGSIDGTIGGMGEGLFRGLANEKSWTGGLGQTFSSVATTTILHGSLGGATGLAGGALFRSLGEGYSSIARKTDVSVPNRVDADVGSTKAGVSDGGSQGSVDDILAKKPVDFEGDTAAQARLMHAAHQTNQRMQVVADETTAEFGLQPTKVGIKGNKFGVENPGDLNQQGFVSAMTERATRGKRPQALGKIRDISRGRFDCDNIDQVNAVTQSLKTRFTKLYGADNVQVLYRKPDDVYQRIHILVRDPLTGIRHEWQVGTKALTTLIEDVGVAVPKGVELHGYDFHTVVYDVLEKLRRSDIRAKYGLPDTIADDIGFSKLSKDYDRLMIEAGTVKAGSTEPTNFNERLMDIAGRLTRALEKLEDNYPGLATKLDTKLSAQKEAANAAKAANRTAQIESPNHARPESSIDGPVSQKDMPMMRPKEPVKPKAPDEPQPLLREEHQSTGQYVENKKATPFLSDGSLSPHSAKQGQLGNCYLIAGCAAQVRADPDSVRRLIQVNSDGSFTVTLHIRKNWYSDAVPKQIKVDNQFPMKGGSYLYAKTGDQLPGEDEMWMAIIEKAMAKEAGGYGHISGGQVNKHISFGGVHELLTGNKVSYVHTKDLGPDELLERISASLDNKESIAVGTWDFSKEVDISNKAQAMNIYANHAYSVESVNMSKRTVTLQNPWGSRHPTDISIEDFAKYYDRLDIGTSATTKGPAVKGPFPEDGAAVDLGLGQASDNLPMAALRTTEAGVMSVTSGKIRNEAESVVKETLLTTNDVEYPGEHVRKLFWSHMSSPKIIRFQGIYGEQEAVFFLNPDTHTVVITELSGTFVTGLTLNVQGFEDLLHTGRL